MSHPAAPLALFACSNETHVRLFDPITRELLEHHGWVSEMLSLDLYLVQDAGPEAADHGLTWSHLDCPVSLRGSYWRDPPLRRVAKRWAAARSFRTVLKEKQPTVLVVGHDASVIEWPLIQLARGRGIAAVLVQDGVRMHLDRPTPRAARWKLPAWWLLRGLGCLTIPPGLRYGHGGCDRIVVYGDALRRALAAEGVPESAIVVTGNPRLDAIPQRAAVREELGLPASTTVVVLATQPLAAAGLLSESDEESLLGEVLRQYAGLPEDLVLVVKLHPRERLDDFADRASRWGAGERLHVIHAEDSMKVMAASDVVVGFHSTVLLEALALGRPVVILDLIPRLDNVFAEALVGPVVRDPAGLCGAVQAALSGRPWETRAEAFVEANCFRVDGQSAHRIADVIADVAKQPREDARA